MQTYKGEDGKTYARLDDGTVVEASPKQGFSEEDFEAASGRGSNATGTALKAVIANEVRKELPPIGEALGLSAGETGLAASGEVGAASLPSSVGGMTTLGGDGVMVTNTGEIIGSATPAFAGQSAIGGSAGTGLSALGTALSLAAIAKGGYDFYQGTKVQQHGGKNTKGGALNGALMGGGTGTLIAPGIGTVIGGVIGGLAGALGGSITGGRHKDWYVRNIFRDAMKEAGILDGQWALTLSDGSRVDFSSDHGPDASGFREYEIDPTATPYMGEAISIGSAFNTLLNGEPVESDHTSVISGQYAGYFTNAFTHNTRSLEDVKRNAAFVALKNGMTPEVMQKRLEALKGTMPDDVYAVRARAVSDIIDAQHRYYGKELNAIQTAPEGSTPIAPQIRPFDDAGTGGPAFVARGALNPDGSRVERVVTKGPDGKNVYGTPIPAQIINYESSQPDQKDATHQQTSALTQAFHNIVGDPADKTSPQYHAQELLNTAGTLEEAKGSLKQALEGMGVNNETAVALLQQKKAQGLISDSEFNSSLYALGTMNNVARTAKPPLPSASQGQYSKGTIPPLVTNHPLDLTKPRSPEAPAQEVDLQKELATSYKPYSEEVKDRYATFNVLGKEYTADMSVLKDQTPLMKAMASQNQTSTRPQAQAPQQQQVQAGQTTSGQSEANPYGFLRYINNASEDEVKTRLAQEEATTTDSSAVTAEMQAQIDAENKRAREKSAADAAYARQAEK